QIGEAHVGRLEVKGSAVVGRRNESKGDVLVQSAEEQKIDSGEIEPGLGDRALDGSTRRIAGNKVDRLMIGTLQMPLGRGSDRNRPIRRILPDWGVSIVPELVSVVAEFLSEAIELGPGCVTRRTREGVFSREGRNDGLVEAGLHQLSIVARHGTVIGSRIRKSHRDRGVSPDVVVGAVTRRTEASGRGRSESQCAQYESCGDTGATDESGPPCAPACGGVHQEPL